MDMQMDMQMNMQMNSKFYTDGAKRMVAEGMETISKIMAFIRENETPLSDMNEEERKKAILEFEPSKQFNQVHPIVFQYLAVERIFSPTAFRRYIMSVYGKPKSKEDEEKMRKDRRYVYHFKNAQMALYVKYLLIESNPNEKIETIQLKYEEMIQELNKNTDRMLDAYEKAEKKTELIKNRLTDEKRKDLVEMLKKMNI